MIETRRFTVATKSPKVPAYKNHLELLSDHLRRLELVLKQKIIERETHTHGLPNFESFSKNVANPETLERDIRSITEKITTATAQTKRVEGQLPLMDIVERFGLDDFERDVLLLALAPALDKQFGRYFGWLRSDAIRQTLDVDVALSLRCSDLADRIEMRRYFSATAPLVKNQLIALDRHRLESGDSFLSLGIRLPQRILGWLLGEDNLDESLQAFTKLLESDVSLDQVVLSDSAKQAILTMISNHSEFVEALNEWKIDEKLTYGRGVVLLFAGPPGTGKTMTAKAIARELNKRLLLVDPQQVFDLKRPIEDNLTDIFREAKLQDAIVFFDECEGLFLHRGNGNQNLSLILSAIEHHDGMIILSTNQPEWLDPALDRRVLYRIEFEEPSISLRRQIWERHLPPSVPLAEDVDLDRLSRTFEFSGGYIKNAVLVAINRALMRDKRPAEITQEDFEDAARSQQRSKLQQFADRHRTPLRLDDLILPTETKNQVREILDAARSRSVVLQEWGFGQKFTTGRGLSALFDGEPGTGKTLCAEILAAELGLPLYRIQVSSVVSKYIGETEKNLTRIFQEASQSQCVLLFDEADSLFSRRTDVKTVQDRYANMEINVLLQLMERYEGLVLLTTNLKHSIDKAFERRLSFKINFPFPESEYRARIWKHLIPPAAPIAEGIDFELMADAFELSGGSIKNAMIRAAYRAAARSSKINMDDISAAAKQECAAAGKLYRVITHNDDF